MVEKKLFNEMDLLISVKMEVINKELSEVRQFLEDQNIPFSTLTSSNEKIGEVLLTALKSLGSFLVEYNRIKETWQYNAPA